MFFRLSKNVVKNVYFDPFEGGYPPSPPPPSYIASAYAFSWKSSFFNKKLIFFILSFGGGGDSEGINPPSADWGVPNVKRRRGEISYIADERIMARVCHFSLARLVICFGILLGMCERVRTRNTLHEVGADLSQAWSWDTVLDWRRATARASEPQPHISQFLIISTFS